MASLVSLFPVVILCAALLAPTPVRSASIIQWLRFVLNFFRTLFYYLFPIKRRQMDAIDASLTDLTSILKDIMPVTGSVRHSENIKFGVGGYVCMSHGYATNFQTFEKVGKAHCTWESGNAVDVNIPYSIKDFRVHYGAFYMKGIRGARTVGTLDIGIGRNKMILRVQVPNVSKMIENIALGGITCYVTITDLYFEDIGNIEPKVNSVGFMGGWGSSVMLTAYLGIRPKVLLKSVRESFLRNIYLKLSKKTKKLCIGQELNDEIEREGYAKERTYSDEFYKRCGTSIEDPSKKLVNPNPTKPKEETSSKGFWNPFSKSQVKATEKAKAKTTETAEPKEIEIAKEN